MKKRSGVSIIVAVTALCIFAVSVSADDVTERMLSTASDNGAFAFDLFSILRQEKGNLFFSPYSISSALAMTYGGARGQTAAQMEEALRFTKGQKGTHEAFRGLGSLLEGIQACKEVELAVANSIWPQTGYQFLPAYTSLLKKYYGVEVTPVDYARAPEPARSRINKWVEDKTKEKIKDLIPQESLDPLTRLVLVNAIYFKGDWEEQFDPGDTEEAPFRVSPDRAVEAKMMTRTGDYPYAELDGAQILELPYAGRDVSMLAILPDERTSLSAVEEKLTLEEFSRWSGMMSTREVKVFLPKFTITWGSFSLVEALKSLGMTDAFRDTKADLSGMDGRTGWLYITDVLHKAFVDVNEEGTEAAAATAVIVGLKSMPAPPAVFRADRPFLFVIRENRSGSILFIGRVADPTKKGQ